MRPSSKKPHLFAPLALLLLTGSATGCGVSIADVCEDMCDCEGCSDGDLDECIEEGEQYEAFAESFGCESEFDDYVDCIDDNAECINGDYELRNEDECENIIESCSPTGF